MDERKNKNRGFKQLRVWQHSIDLYVLTNTLLKDLPYDHLKTKSNIIDAAHSIGRNIAEGYCRKSIREYLNFLNIALGSCGELNSSFLALKQANLVDAISYAQFDSLHYQTENELLALTKSIQQKMNNNEKWDDNYGKQ